MNAAGASPEMGRASRNVTPNNEEHSLKLPARASPMTPKRIGR
jgi:hypothetical protein